MNALNESGQPGIDQHLQRQHVLNSSRVRYARNRRGWVFVHANGGLSKGYESREAAADAFLQIAPTKALPNCPSRKRKDVRD